MNSEFTIKDWSAFAPGLERKEDWVAWAVHPFLPSGEATPALSEMPPMQRRRVEKLGRMALQVAFWCQQGEAAGVPLVFASRHGDLARTHEMLRALAQDEPLSPTQFGLSTHNAIAAQYSITRKLHGNYMAASAGVAGVEAAVVEALGLLADGCNEVLIVVYDSPLPEAYAVFADEPQAAFAWAARLGRPGQGDVCYQLEVGGNPTAVVDRADTDLANTDPINTDQAERILPHGLEVLRFLIGGPSALDLQEGRRSWRWRQHA